MSNELGDTFDGKLFSDGMRRLHEAIDQKDAERKGKGGDAASLRKDRTDDVCGNDGADSK